MPELQQNSWTAYGLPAPYAGLTFWSEQSVALDQESVFWEKELRNSQLRFVIDAGPTWIKEPFTPRPHRTADSQLTLPMEPESRTLTGRNDLSDDTAKELRWLAENQNAYGGQWVAVKGDRLIAHSESAKEVFRIADSLHIENPLVVKIDPPDMPPFGGW